MTTDRIASLTGALCLGLMFGLLVGGGDPVAVLFSGLGAALMVAVCVAAQRLP